MSRLGMILARVRASRRLRPGLYAGVALLAVVDVGLSRPHEGFWWDVIPGFHVLYGVVSCVVIIIVSKALGHWWLMRDEDYYD